MFTAPVSGRYFFSAVLTGHKNVKIEAVLSKSNYGIARGDSAGYQPEGLEKPVAEAKQTPGSLVVFNIILRLQEGDTVCIDLVTGKLANSIEPLTIFSGMLLYEWTDTPSYRELWLYIFRIETEDPEKYEKQYALNTTSQKLGHISSL